MWGSARNKDLKKLFINTKDPDRAIELLEILDIAKFYRNQGIDIDGLARIRKSSLELGLDLNPAIVEDIIKNRINLDGVNFQGNSQLRELVDQRMPIEELLSQGNLKRAKELGEVAGKKVPDLADPQVKRILGDTNVNCRIGARVGLALGVVDCLDPVIIVRTKSELKITSGRLRELNKFDLGEIPLEVPSGLLDDFDLPTDFNKLSSEEQLYHLKVKSEIDEIIISEIDEIKSGISNVDLESIVSRHTDVTMQKAEATLTGKIGQGESGTVFSGRIKGIDRELAFKTARADSDDFVNIIDDLFI
jgi:hypothetical protein